MPWFRSLLGTAFLAGACANPADSPTEPLTLDFGKGQVTSWRALNDGVMGGRSIGVVQYDRKSMTWAGTVSLENNGGFSSVRSEWGERDLSAFGAMTLRCRTTTGEPDTFTLTMETSEQWWMPYAYASFSPSEEWGEVVLDVSDFGWSQAQMGDLRSVTPSKEWSDILRVGLMKYDGTAQAFDLEVASIALLPRQRAGSKP